MTERSPLIAAILVAWSGSFGLLLGLSSTSSKPAILVAVYIQVVLQCSMAYLCLNKKHPKGAAEDYIPTAFPGNLLLLDTDALNDRLTHLIQRIERNSITNPVRKVSQAEERPNEGQL